jgi:hypothetical protein
MIKRLFFLVALMLTFASVSNAQGVEITPFAGYSFGDKFPIEGGEVKIGGGASYGGKLAFIASEKFALELTYNRVNGDGTAHSVYFEDGKNLDAGVNTNYFLIGASRLFPLSDEVVLFAGLDLGGVYLLAPSKDFKSSTTFAAGVNAGVKYFFNERFGLRGQATLLFPVTSMGSSYWWDPVNDGTTGTTSNVPLLQFGFTAGIIYKISL